MRRIDHLTAIARTIGYWCAFSLGCLSSILGRHIQYSDESFFWVSLVWRGRFGILRQTMQRPLLDIHNISLYFIKSFSFPPMALRPIAGHGPLIHDVSRSHTTTHHSRYDSSGRMISSSQRPLPDKTQQTDIHAPGGIRTHDLSRRAAADLRLRPRGYWDRR